MDNYEELVEQLRCCASHRCNCAEEAKDGCWDGMITEAADAIEQLSRLLDESIPKGDAEIIISEVAKAMHTWIFLNTGDEQKAYDECGLSDEINAALGYGGRFEIVVPKEETE